VWLFKAGQPPPRDHPVGAYFTSLSPSPEKRRALAKKLFIPRRKCEFLFAFSGRQGLLPLEGDRGEFVFYSPVDYPVQKDRQRFEGAAADTPKELL
jgi:hypothetical protein